MWCVLSMVLQQWIDPLQLFVKRMQVFSQTFVLSRHDIVKAVESHVNPSKPNLLKLIASTLEGGSIQVAHCYALTICLVICVFS